MNKKSAIKLGASKAEIIYWAIFVGGIIAAILVFSILRSLSFRSSLSFKYPFVATAVIFLIALAGSWMPASAMSKSAKIIYRTTVTVFALLLLTGYVPEPPGISSEASRWFIYGPIIGILAAVLSFWRPSFALVTYCMIYMYKHFVSDAWQIYISPSDWMPVVQTSIILVLGSIAIVCGKAYTTKKAAAGEASIEADRLPLLDALVIFVIGIQLSNYFWSGIAKVALNGGPLAWLLENRTDVLMDVAAYAGYVTIGYGFPFSEVARQAFYKWLLVLNFAPLFLQFACLLAFWRRRFLIAFMILFELHHLVIFLITGLFFVHWIILNTALAFALSKINRERIPFGVGVAALIICLCAKSFFFVAKLGWYDSRSVNHTRFYAIAENGREAEVPSNFFGPVSLTVGQMRIPEALGRGEGRPKHMKMMQTVGFATGTWGSTKKYKTMRDGMTCKLPVLGGEYDPDDQQKIALFMRNWHNAMLRSVDANGLIQYDLYPHHLWSDPFRYEEFRLLDKRTIVAYRWVQDSVCVDPYGYFGGQKLVHRISQDIPLR
jgi:hypothetical protein